MYTSYMPTIYNNTYINNSALFNNDIADYAVKIRELDDSNNLTDLVNLDNIPSGLQIETPIILAVVAVG